MVKIETDSALRMNKVYCHCFFFFDCKRKIIKSFDVYYKNYNQKIRKLFIAKKNVEETNCDYYFHTFYGGTKDNPSLIVTQHYRDFTSVQTVVEFHRVNGKLVYINEKTTKFSPGELVDNLFLPHKIDSLPTEERLDIEHTMTKKFIKDMEDEGLNFDDD